MKEASHISPKKDSVLEFLKTEVRCGYQVSAEMKAVWAVQLDILKQILDICKRHRIRVWMAGGSLLGAVRHQGYIPWDDDIDLMMPRADYRRFCRIAPRELSSDLFLQTQYSDPSFHIPMAKVRKNGTAAIDQNEGMLGFTYHMGVFVDIFPLDAFPRDGELVKRIFRHLDKFKAIRWIANLPSWRFCCFYGERYSLLEKCRRLVYSLFRLRFPNAILTYFSDRVVTRYGSRADYPLVMCPAWWNLFSGGKLDCSRWSYPRELLEDTREVPFEYLRVPIPMQAEKILDITYGQWHEFVHGTACHTGLILDLKCNYREVLIEKFGYRASDFR